MKKIDKKNSFKTPEGYFENLSDRILNGISEEIDETPEKKDFAVPEDYFEKLNASIIKKANLETGKIVELNSIDNYIAPSSRKYYYMAASVAAIILMVFGINWNTQKETTFDDLASAEIENYFENNEFGLTTYEIAEVIPVDELEINDILESRFEEENIVEYLNENIEDFEDLNLENHE